MSQFSLKKRFRKYLLKDWFWGNYFAGISSSADYVNKSFLYSAGPIRFMGLFNLAKPEEFHNK